LWINETTERMTTLKHPSLYRLYHTLSGNDLKKEQGRLWEAYLRRAELRNGIVHKGAHASKAQATDAYNTALDLIHHFEAVRAGVVK
jgi:transposase